jgi:4-oxalomesaconate tautomerase
MRNEEAVHAEDHTASFSIEHPSGEFTVSLAYEKTDNEPIIHNSGVLRTARILSKGEVFIDDAS